MILHVGNVGTFLVPFIDLVGAEFKKQDHYFWLNNTSNSDEFAKTEMPNNVFVAKKNTIFGQVSAYVLLLIKLHRSNKIILHGLFNPKVIVILTLCPWVIKKCYWVMWGGDYLYRRLVGRSYKFYIMEPFRKFLIKNIPNVITYIPESVEIIRKDFDSRAKWHECLCYTSNTFDESMLFEFRNTAGFTNVLIGNSATKTNQHHDAFQKIAPYVDDYVRVYAPLSYGDKYYAEFVIEVGEQVFGNKFSPLRDFLPREEYQKFLSTIDVVVFNHNRHQGMGGVINILGLGKTLYMRSDVASWPFLNRLGLDVFDIDKFDGFERKADSEKNFKIVRTFFSKSKLIDQWKQIFDS